MLKDLLRLYVIFKPVRGMALLGLFLSVLTALANIGLLAVSGWFIAAMGLAGVAGVTINYFSPAAAIRGLAIIRTAGRYGERLATHDAAFRFIAAFRPWIFDRIDRLSLSTRDYLPSGELFDTLRADIDRVEKFYLGAVVPIITALLTVLVTAVGLSFYQVELSLVLTVFLGLAGIGLPWLVLILSRQPTDVFVSESTTMRVAAIDMIQGLGEIVVYGRDAEALRRVMTTQTAVVEAQGRLHFYESLAQIGQAFLMHAAGLCLFAIAALMVLGDGVAPPAELAMLPLLVMASFEVLLPIPAALQIWDSARHALRRIFAIADGAGEPATPETPVDGRAFRMEFDAVSFGYGDHGPDCLQDISFGIGAGDVVAITGATGSGKSSLIPLMTGFRVPRTGMVRGAGNHAIAVAAQTPYVFSDSLLANLRIAAPAAPDDVLDRVCTISGLDEVIRNLPDGYNTRVGAGGVLLSGGQARRLSIARALLKDAPCLVLDEPDEGLDPVSCQAMMDRIRAEAKARNQALVIITHNRTILRPADREIVIAEGRMHENGLAVTAPMLAF